MAQNILTPPLEIYVEMAPKGEKLPKNAKEFLMTPEGVTIGNMSAGAEPSKKTNFKIHGQLDRSEFCIQEPLTGFSKFKIMFVESRTEHLFSLTKISLFISSEQKYFMESD